MKKFFVVTFLLLCPIILLPTLARTTRKTVHDDAAIQRESLYIIGGEITNTDTVIGIFKVEQNHPTFVIEYQTKNQDIEDIYYHLRDILADVQRHHGIGITNACFAIPGIAKGDLFLHPHLPWNTSDNEERHLDTSQKGISKQKFLDISKLQHVYFINNFQAVALGTQLVDASSMRILQRGNDHPRKPKLVIGAGNGLGASLLVWDSQCNRYVPTQLNYSFTEFGAQSDVELAFFNFMQEKTGNIAWGKVLGAGAGGIKLMYRFFEEYDSKFECRKYEMEKFVEYEHYLDIFRNRDHSARCQDAVSFFIDQYAKIIRNVSYAQAVYGGVYITNTVAQEFPELFTHVSFIDKIVNLSGRVLDEGSRRYLEGYLAEIPFYLASNTKAQLYGAAALCIEPNLIRN